MRKKEKLNLELSKIESQINVLQEKKSNVIEKIAIEEKRELEQIMKSNNLSNADIIDLIKNYNHE